MADRKLRMYPLEELKVEQVEPDEMKTALGAFVNVGCFNCGSRQVQVWIGQDLLLIICEGCQKFLAIGYDAAALIGELSANKLMGEPKPGRDALPPSLV